MRPIGRQYLCAQRIVLAITLHCLVVYCLSACVPAKNNFPQLIAQNTNSSKLLLLTNQYKENATLPGYQFWMLDVDGDQAQRVTTSVFDTLLSNAIIKGMVWDEIYHRIIISEGSKQALYVIDLDGNNTSVLSDRVQGGGVDFGQLGNLIIDSYHERIVVIDEIVDELGVQRILSSVDLNTGQRKELSSRQFGDGPLVRPHALAVDANSNRFYVAYDTGILAIDGYTGDRWRLSDAREGIGVGAQWLQADTIHYDSVGQRLLVTDSVQQKVFSVALATGNRSLVTSWENSLASASVWGQSAVFADEHLILANQFGVAVKKIDVGLGDCEITGANFEAPAHCRTSSELQTIDMQVNELNCLSYYMGLARKKMKATYPPHVLPIIYPFVYPFAFWRIILEAPGLPQAESCEKTVIDEVFLGYAASLAGLIVIIAIIDSILNPKPAST